MTSNPFRQPIPKQGIILRLRVWTATNEGKDDTRTNFYFLATNEYLWFGRDLSVPLAWVSEVGPVGPGFHIKWKNPINGTTEQAFLCVRTLLGYNKRRRDEIVSMLQEFLGGVSASASPVEVQPDPTSAVVQADPTLAVCEVCGAPQAKQYDLVWFTNIIAYWSFRPDRKVLCPDHARPALRRMLLSNSLLGPIGFPGIFFIPYKTYAISKEAYHSGILTFMDVLFYTALSALPISCMVLLMSLSIAFKA
ncbi:MAG: hypothetical protein ACMUIL_01030 [bacterium]